METETVMVMAVEEAEVINNKILSDIIKSFLSWRLFYFIE